MERKVSMIIGVLFGVALIVVAVIKPPVLWNHELIHGVRSTLGDMLAMVFVIGAGVVMIGGSLLLAKGKAR